VLAQSTGRSIIPTKLERIKSADEEYLGTKQRGVRQDGAILLNMQASENSKGEDVHYECQRDWGRRAI